MLRVTVVLAMALAACVDSSVETNDGEVSLSCDVDSLLGCRAAGVSCTWCAPIGNSCTRAFVDTCGGGQGWCSEESVCRQVCSPVDFPRCPIGTVESFERRDGVDADVCYCAPE